MSRSRRILILIIAVLILSGVLIFVKRSIWYPRLFGPTESGITESMNRPPRVEVVARGLDTPWEIAVLDGGDVLVTERGGTLSRIGQNGERYTISGVTQTSEGGLLGLALHPDFERNNWLYLYLTTQSEGALINRVERYRYDGRELLDKTIILNNIPASANHDGGRIAFGPDNLLYITTGDAGDEQSAQDVQKFSGKILRVSDTGAVPRDNPFKNPVYSYGHRNPQGLAWDTNGVLWATEHGRSGIRSGFDELNRIQKGANYGWPIIEGDESRGGMEAPVAHSGPDETWAPADMIYIDGSLYFAGLRGQSLYEANIQDEKVRISRHFSEQYGRLRAIAIDSSERVYIGTSNRDGRGTPAQDDDRILRFSVR